MNDFEFDSPSFSALFLSPPTIAIPTIVGVLLCCCVAVLLCCCVVSAQQHNTAAKVICPPEYKYASWIGGSTLSGLSVTQQSWMRSGASEQHSTVLGNPYLQYLFGSQDGRNR